MRRRPVLGVLVASALLLGATAATVHQARVRPGYEGDDLVVLLVIGSDAGPPQRPGDPLEGLADAVHLVAVDPRRPAATVVDIPRDTVVEGSKLNAYLATGGPDLLRDRLATFTGVPIDFWILTSFSGLAQLVDAAGGVTVDVDVPMHDPFSGSNLEPGTQRLDGGQALAFARDRHSMPDGDFGRTRHQGELLRAAHRDATGRDLAQLVGLTAAISRTTVSDIPAADLFPLVLQASRTPPEAVLHVPLRGRVTTVDGQSVVVVEPGDAFTRLQAGQAGPDEVQDGG